MQRIIVGVDDQRPTETAVDWACAHAAPGSRLELVTGTEIPDPDLAQRRLDVVKTRAKSAAQDVTVSTVLWEKPVAETLIERSRVADLMVLGIHRARHLRPGLAGSLSFRIAGRAACPTVIVPDDAIPDRRGRIVVGLGDHPADIQVVRVAAGEAARTSSDLLIVHAWQLPAPRLDEIDLLSSHADDIRSWHARYVRDTTDQVRAVFPALPVGRLLVEGEAGPVLAGASEGAALVVLGNRGPHSVADALYGSTARYVVVHTGVPVYLVPFSVHAAALELDSSIALSAESRV